MLMSLEAGLPQWLRGKESTCNVQHAGDMGSIPGLGTSPAGSHGNPLQYSCQENTMDREPGSPWGCKESNTGLKCLSTHAHTSLKAMQGETLLAYVLSEVS